MKIYPSTPISEVLDRLFKDYRHKLTLAKMSIENPDAKPTIENMRTQEAVLMKQIEALETIVAMIAEYES